MAKITPGSLAGSVSGSVGNDTFSHNRYGAYLRRRVIPTKSQSIEAYQAKARLGAASQAWGNLTTDQRTAWATWAKSNPITDRLGQKQVLTGHAGFVKLNAVLDKIGVAIIDVPPVVGAPDALTTLSATLDIGAGDFELAFTPTPLGATKSLWIEAAVVNSPGVSYVENLFKLVDVSAANQATGYDVQTAIEERFGGLMVGQRVIFKVRVADRATGLLSAPLITGGAVTTS